MLRLLFIFIVYAILGLTPLICMSTIIYKNSKKEYIEYKVKQRRGRLRLVK